MNLKQHFKTNRKMIKRKNLKIPSQDWIREKERKKEKKKVFCQILLQIKKKI